MSFIPLSAAVRAWRPSSFAFLAFSALRCVMLAISSSEELVSSSEAACSLAPSASDWLAEFTCEAAAAVCSEPLLTCSAIALREPVVERVMKKAMPSPSSVATPSPMSAPTVAVCRSRAEPSDMAAVFSTLVFAADCAWASAPLAAVVLLAASSSRTCHFLRNSDIAVS
ncbi:hypothetical protein SDC9_191034 [bioreactor metagenome]|uniref:Uncharacterized protein n=1 Tax=bioreactor metagenome TaxID=1076179 RepID=A0A645I4Y3_9ZZZZ